MKKIKTLIISIILISSFSLSAPANESVEVFKTPSCGCCYGYVLFLEEENFKVKQTDMRSLHSIKKRYNIKN